MKGTKMFSDCLLLYTGTSWRFIPCICYFFCVFTYSLNDIWMFIVGAVLIMNSLVA